VPYRGLPESQQWWISCTTQAGLNGFLAELSELVKSRYGATDGEAALITRARHREHVSAALDALDAFEQLAGQGAEAPLDLACEELRTAANELGRISGRVDTEELLDVIFRDFCIGK
jgi:tRNA modification GTPase